MEEKELRQLAIDISENKVFGTFHMKDSEMETNLGMVFMPFVFMSEEQRKEMIDKKVVHFYEYIDKAGPRSVNGMPCFFSMKNIIQKDWKKIVKYIKEYGIRVKSFLDKKDVGIEPKESTLF